MPELQDLYRDMVLVRRFDREANALQRQGQLGIWVPLLGQEAAQIGAGRALAPQDMAFPSYREHGVAWCRGIDPTELLGIFRGTDHGSWDPKATRFHLYTIVIGNQCLNATGYAMGQKFESKVGDGPDAEATICFFGDGATSQGDVHEGIRLGRGLRRAGRLLLPEQPVGDLRAHRAADPGAAVPARAGLRLPRHPGRRQRRARLPRRHPLGAGGVPHRQRARCSIEAFTYRMDAHTTSDDPTRYRLADELELWKLKDPIERVRVHLVRDAPGGAGVLRRASRPRPTRSPRGSAQFCMDMPAPGARPDLLRGLRGGVAAGGGPAGRRTWPTTPRSSGASMAGRWPR